MLGKKSPLLHSLTSWLEPERGPYACRILTQGFVHNKHKYRTKKIIISCSHNTDIPQIKARLINAFSPFCATKPAEEKAITKIGPELHNHASLNGHNNKRMAGCSFLTTSYLLENWVADLKQSANACEAELSAEDITDSWGFARSKLCGMSIQRCAHRTKTPPACVCVHSQCEIAEILSTNNLGIEPYQRSSGLHISAEACRLSCSK